MIAAPSNTRLVMKLCQGRWNLPVVSRLHIAKRERFSALASSLDASPDSLSRALKGLTRSGWVAHERIGEPSYVLTSAGRKIAPPCAAIVEISTVQRHHALALRRWTLPIINALRGWELRFAELRAMLPDITPRALALALKDMQAAGLVEREILPTFPPTPSYRLTDSADVYRSALQNL